MDPTTSQHHTVAPHNATMTERLAEIDAKLAYLTERQKKTEELITEMTPVLREVMNVATARLDEIDKKGYFDFGREIVKIGDRVVTSFTPDDVRAFGDAVVGILETVRALTQPKVLEIASSASEALEQADKAEPIGLLGMVKATRDDDVQKGMAVMMEVMRHVGRAVVAVREQRAADPNELKKAKLAAAIGPRRTKPAALGIERTPPRPRPAPPARASKEAAPPAAAPPAIEGVAFSADGHLADPAAWSPDLAAKIAAIQSVALDEPRWAVIRFARAEFEKTGASPNIRRLTQGTELATKDLYALFPKAPARTVAKIAGIPKPVGCI